MMSCRKGGSGRVRARSPRRSRTAYLLEQQGQPYALLDLDYLSWAGTGAGDRAAEFGLMLQNLAAVAANYRRAGLRTGMGRALTLLMFRMIALPCRAGPRSPMECSAMAECPVSAETRTHVPRMVAVRQAGRGTG